jgi:hypothetical protein
LRYALNGALEFCQCQFGDDALAEASYWISAGAEKSRCGVRDVWC